MRIILRILLYGIFCFMAGVSAQTSDMVLIPAGDFQMGSNKGEGDEKPVHTVYLDAFYIDTHEVTVGEYKQFVEATNHRALPNSVSRTSPNGSASCRGGHLARCDDVCPVGRQAIADRSRVGKGGTRWINRTGLSVGET